MTNNNTQDAGAGRWSVVLDTPLYTDEDWDDDDDVVLPDTQDAPTQATSEVDATEVRLVWKWVLTEKDFAARPDPHGRLFHAEIYEDLGVVPGEGISGTLTVEESTIRYSAYDFAGGGIDEQTRGRVERELLAWAEQGGPDSAPEAVSADSSDADPQDDGRSSGAR